jgi:hypothetical protein
MFLSIIKDLRMPDRKLVIKRDYERVVFGEVYIPGQEDAHGNIMSSEEIKKSCYRFMQNQRTYKVDLMHDSNETGSYIVEIFIARSGDPDFIEGSWVAATKIESDEIWDKIIKGEINCYSLAGLTNLDKKVETVPRIVEASGNTQENLDELVPPHFHTFSIKLDNDNKIVPCLTGYTFNHAHFIKSTSVTEEEFGHSHRYVYNGD